MYKPQSGDRIVGMFMRSPSEITYETGTIVRCKPPHNGIPPTYLVKFDVGDPSGMGRKIRRTLDASQMEILDDESQVDAVSHRMADNYRMLQDRAKRRVLGVPPNYYETC